MMQVSWAKRVREDQWDNSYAIIAQHMCYCGFQSSLAICYNHAIVPIFQPFRFCNHFNFAMKSISQLIIEQPSHKWMPLLIKKSRYCITESFGPNRSSDGEGQEIFVELQHQIVIFRTSISNQIFNAKNQFHRAEKQRWGTEAYTL